MAAYRLASKGKTMADAGYDAEVSGIQAFLSMQHDKSDATPLSPGQVSLYYCLCSEIIRKHNIMSFIVKFHKVPMRLVCSKCL